MICSTSRILGSVVPMCGRQKQKQDAVHANRKSPNHRCCCRRARAACARAIASAHLSKKTAAAQPMLQGPHSHGPK